jgi:hypothetical protein
MILLAIRVPVHRPIKVSVIGIVAIHTFEEASCYASKID